MSKLIPLTQGKFAIVDDWNYQWLSKWKWYSAKDDNRYYVQRNGKLNGKLKTIKMHREILRARQGEITDHCNHNGLDNREQNLRFCNNSQNQGNRRGNINSSSQFKGVSWGKRQKRWYAEIKCEGKRIYLGLFIKEIEAAKAYDSKAQELFGEFACTNF